MEERHRMLAGPDNDPSPVERFGVAYTVKSTPEELKTQGRGRNPVHHELCHLNP